MNKFLPSILLISLTALGILVVNMYTNYYFFNDIKVLNDKKEVLQKANDSLPVQAVITHQNWGTVQINDEVRLYAITSLLSKLEHKKKAVSMLNDESDFFSCTITYLNGTKKRYFLSETLIRNESRYDESYPKSTIISFYTYLLSLFYTPEKIATFASRATEITLKSSEGTQKLTLKQKGAFLHTLQVATELTNQQRLSNSHQSLKQTIGFVTIFQGEPQTIRKSEGIIHITVLKNYFVVRYLGDPNGKAIYFTGDLTTFLPAGRKES
ncbi:DUF3919 family protein [Priestia aryabhattai]|uniref:DUF3919 family protein n=1 Tax=Priestia aryabhattai TaxID=412384 RepID=UPI001CCFBA6F|nr:DUF3919 family protein [Priestia aryabhattai]MBZ6485122.1 DUF3919 family protein [Priestia aryabhattai]